MRYITNKVIQSLQDFPSVLLIGARQVGKSTLAQQLVKRNILQAYLTLDDMSTLITASHYPDQFLAQHHEPVAIDEIQRVPDLMRTLKKTIDQDRRAGRFLLTGSANVLAYPKVSESLAGRVDVIPLEGFSLSELCSRDEPSPLLHVLLQDIPFIEKIKLLKQHLKTTPTFTANDLYENIFFGAFPEVALKRTTTFQQRWCSSYQATYIEKDVRDLAKLDILGFAKLYRLVGLRTANLLNIKDLAVTVGLDQRTITRYLEVLEITFQALRIPPWSTNTTKRLIKMPKIYMLDSAMGCYLAGIDEPKNIPQHMLCGALLETWVFAELRKLLMHDTATSISFYRTHQGREVDFVIERGLSCVGIEVKAANQVTVKDLAGLQDLQQATNGKVQGIILYTGDEIVTFGDSLAAIPMRCLI